MDWIFKYVYPILPATIIVLGILYRRGRRDQKWENIVNLSNLRIDGLDQNMEKLLSDNVLLIRRPDCDARRRDFAHEICNKIEFIRKALEKIEERREDAVLLNNQRWLEVFERLGRIEGLKKSE